VKRLDGQLPGAAVAGTRAALVELSVSWAERRWRARGAGVDAEHEELRALEDLVAAQLAGSGAERVAMRFEFASFPAWMRQHQSHYFNYVLTLAPPQRRSGVVDEH
jgi:hypothetical protein